MLIQGWLDFFRDLIIYLVAPIVNFSADIGVTEVFQALYVGADQTKAVLAAILPNDTGLAAAMWATLVAMMIASFLAMIGGPLVKAIVRRIP